MKTTFLSRRSATLVELIVTIVLISIIVITTFGAYSYVNTFLMKADNYASATEFLCQTLEGLYNSTYASLASNATNLLPEESNLRSRYAGTMSYTVSAETRWDTTWADTTTNGYRYITATVSWNDGALRTLTLSMRRTRS